ncbi:sodium:solute symporter family protein [Candidatus Contubernalis alkaliaceticus]|uniref:sodium:solute symporter family protein n=1 Tax=Candidatus Contubernalis alkaliaceticus TaxID=338645 RepID=UPI001F4C11DD|nr:sodium:solute symporter family protein [Candidatus Contubernalis alkalaceticus]UNC91524.1 sodium:solute symporter family protein [Candidatus Contubernalis alkalaceticus]
MMRETVVFIFIGIYLCILLLLGWLGTRVTLATREDYFLASRSLNTFHLFMALFASNITSFTIIGHAGLSYHAGYGAYGYVIGWSLFATPFTYYLVGYRSWLLGKRFGYSTQPQLFGSRWNSSTIGILFLVLLLYYTIPYLVLGIIGGGIAMSTMTGGVIPYWLAALVLLCVSVFYTMGAGLRGTTWTDIFQGLLFMIVAVFVLLGVANSLGGFEAITAKILADKPHLLERALAPQLSPKTWFSFSFVNSIAVVVFPQMFIRIMAAKNSVSMKKVTLFYPICFMIIFGISTLLGVWGAVSIPGLEGQASDDIVPMLLEQFLSPVWGALGLLVILAVIKSSLDSQLLSVSHMVTEDFLLRYFKNITEKKAIFISKTVLLVFAIIAYVGALFRPSAVLSIAAFAFSGFSLLLPVMIAGLYWKKCSKYAAITAIIVPSIFLHLWYLNILPNWTTFGLMPVVPAFFMTVFLLVVVTYLFPSKLDKNAQHFFDIFARAFEGKQGLDKKSTIRL